MDKDRKGDTSVGRVARPLKKASLADLARSAQAPKASSLLDLSPKPLGATPSASVPQEGYGFQRGRLDEVLAPKPLTLAGTALAEGVLALEDVPTHLLDVDEYNARLTHLSEEIDQLGDSLVENGQITPCRGYRTEKGRVALIEGGQRLNAAVSRGLPTLRVEIVERPKDAISAYVQSYLANDGRSRQSGLDDAVRWNQLIDEGMADVASLAKLLNKKEDTIYHARGIASIPKRLISVMKEHPLLSSLSGAYEISRLWPGRESARENLPYDPEAEADRIIAKVRDRGTQEGDSPVTRAELRSLVTKVIQGAKSQRMRGVTKTVDWGAVSGTLKWMQKSKTIQLTMPASDQAEAQALMDKLHRLLASGTSPDGAAG